MINFFFGWLIKPAWQQTFLDGLIGFLEFMFVFFVIYCIIELKNNKK